MKQSIASVFKKLKDEYKDCRNTLVITDDLCVSFFLDIVDGGDDFYFDTIPYHKPEPTSNFLAEYFGCTQKAKKQIKKYKGHRLFSCVGTIVPLKGFIDDQDYNRMVSFWNANHKVKVKEI